MNNDLSSSSAFVDADTYTAEWTDITLLQRRSHNVIYVASRYGRRFLLKTLTPDAARLSDFRLAQEKEFRLGIALSHPNIATTYGLEEIKGVGRCIVQEWIDGMTFNEWIQTNPSAMARERVLDQLLDALDYLHRRQFVHHDLKSSNILITRNGANLKLIDFGLSDTDDSLSPLGNNPSADLQAMGDILPDLLPKGHLLARRCRQGKVPIVAALRHAISLRKRVLRLIPVGLSVAFLMVASILFFLSWYEKHEEQQRYENMLAQVDFYIAQEREQLVYILDNQPDLATRTKEFTKVCRHFWTVRDSVMSVYDENDPLRDQMWQIWVRKQTELDIELGDYLYNP